MRESELWSRIRGQLLYSWGADQIPDMTVTIVERTVLRMQTAANPDELLHLAVDILTGEWPEYEYPDDDRRKREFWMSFIRDLLPGNERS